jgi:predicted small secreted protein
MKITHSLAAILVSLAFILAGCSGADIQPVAEEEGEASFLTGKTGGLKIMDFGADDKSDSMPVNALLWRASLEIAAFVPLADVDTFGGSILTEWYSLAERPDERIKLMIFVVGRELRSDAIQVRVFAQKAENNAWGAATRDEDLASKIEELILTRAREMRAASIAETAE